MKALRSVLFAFLGVASTVGVIGQPTTPPRVALVFDDGPLPEHTEGILAVLAREQVRATFSHVGQNVAAHPELANAVYSAGHEINNHTYTHPHFTTLDDVAIQREVRDTQAAILVATGRSPRWFWAPYGDWDDRIAAAVDAAGMAPFPSRRFSFVSSEDWRTETSAEAILRNATTGIRDCTLILCHEWRAETLAVLPAIIAELKRQGCVFVTFSELEALTDAPETITQQSSERQTQRIHHRTRRLRLAATTDHHRPRPHLNKPDRERPQPRSDDQHPERHRDKGCPHPRPQSPRSD